MLKTLWDKSTLYFCGSNLSSVTLKTLKIKKEKNYHSQIILHKTLKNVNNLLQLKDI